LYTVDKMTVLRINRKTLADQVFDQVVDAIVRGDIAAGAPIGEVEIAERFGVSRAPAREAIFRLEAKGLVTRAAHLGARVVELSPRDLAELYQMREALEGMACRLAAERMTEADLQALAKDLARHETQIAEASGKGYFQGGGDQDFHFRIARAGGNERLERALCDNLYDVMRLYRFRSSLQPGRAKSALSEHRAILAALRLRDGDKAEAAMRQHIRKSWANITQTLQKAGPAR
jgi:DNA-binding GntR family transcriptional regulator